MSKKLYFYYGAMNSGKSLFLLSNVHNYEQQGKKVLLLKPIIDTRNPSGKIYSRIGISHDAIEFAKEDSLFDIVNNNKENLDCVFVDEIHMATRKQVRELVEVCDNLKINVITFGLKNSYVDSCIFDSVQEILYQTNSIQEIKSTCEICNSKATHHLRVLNGNIIYNGDAINCGDVEESEDYYMSVCRNHYYNPKLK